MKQEEKQLLLIDLCSRLPYGVICNLYDVEDADKKFQLKELSYLIISAINSGCIKPYLRPMSSMTKEEEKECNKMINLDTIQIGKDFENPHACMVGLCCLNWLNKHHFDYRGLIPMGLSLEALEWMYK